MFTAPKILWRPPATGGHRPARLGRWLVWNVPTRLWPRPRIIGVYGYEFVGHTDCNMAHRLMFIRDGLFEYDEMQFFRRFVAPGDTVVDVGAHVGAFTLLFAGLVPEGRVVALEPTPGSFARLCENLDRNDLRWRVTAINTAVGREQGSVGFKSGVATTGNRIVAAGMDATGAIEVPCTTLDRLVDEAGLERVDFVKIDTEGFEENVILGGQQFLERLKPQVVLFEANGLCLEYGSDLSQAMEVLASRNYRLGMYDHDGNTIRLIRGKAPTVSPTDNYFAFSAEFVERVGDEVHVIEVEGAAVVSQGDG